MYKLLHLISLSVALSFGATTTVSSLPKNLAALSSFAETAKAKDSFLLKNESKSSIKYFNQFKIIVLCYLALTSCSLLPKVGPQHPQTGYTDIAEAAEQGKIAPLLEIIEKDPIEQRRLSALAQLQFFLRLEKSDRRFNLPSINILRKLFSVLDKENNRAIRKEILNAIGMALFLTKQNLQAQPMREEKVAALYQLYFEENEDENKTILAALEEAGSPFNFANLVEFFIYLATQPSHRQNAQLQAKVMAALKRWIENDEEVNPASLQKLYAIKLFSQEEAQKSDVVPQETERPSVDFREPETVEVTEPADEEVAIEPLAKKKLEDLTLTELRELIPNESDLERLVLIVEKMVAKGASLPEEVEAVRSVVDQINQDQTLEREKKSRLRRRATILWLQMLQDSKKSEEDLSDKKTSMNLDPGLPYQSFEAAL